MSDSDDDTPQLSAHALAALQEFYSEQTVAEENEEQDEQKPVMPSEDWQLSQFWYSDATAEVLAKEAIAVAGDHGRIVCVSCPTLYAKLREIKPETCRAICLEFDTRFEKFREDFLFYDYNKPLEIPKDWEHSFDIVVADPPFLSEECLTKTALTIRFLAKEKLILCSGAIMETLANRLLNTTICPFIPAHTRNLANEFRCYANYATTYLNSRNPEHS